MQPSRSSCIPVLAFLTLCLPAGASAFGLAAWVQPNAPALAPPIQAVLGTAAFAVAVEGAADCCLWRSGRLPLIQRILHLRRNRLRYAILFAILGATATGAAEILAARFGIPLAIQAGPSGMALAAVLLFAIGWVILGSAGARHGLIHRALDEALRGRS